MTLVTMSSRRRRIALALVCGALSTVVLPLLLPGDWTPYAIELALLGIAISLFAYRAQGSTWTRGTIADVVGRALRLVIVSLFVLVVGCTAVFVGASAITGCPIMGDPTGTLTLVNADTVLLEVLPQDGVARVRLLPGERQVVTYGTACGADVQVAAAFEGAWVYCWPVARREIRGQDLPIARGQLRCTPRAAPS
jgi:hypothetical protein